MIDQKRRRAAEVRAREERWRARGRARVADPRYGEVVVPCSSRLTALENAAEVWGCGWEHIRSAEVWAALPEDGKVTVPMEFCHKEERAKRVRGV